MSVTEITESLRCENSKCSDDDEMRKVTGASIKIENPIQHEYRREHGNKNNAAKETMNKTANLP